MLARKPVMLLVGTGYEVGTLANITPELKELHRQSAIRMIQEAQKRGWPVILTEQSRSFLKQCHAAGINTHDLIFTGGTRPFYAGNFYDLLTSRGILPSVVVVGGHYRDKCVAGAVGRILRKRSKNGTMLKIRAPRVNLVIGMASVPSLDYGGTPIAGAKPITMQQLSAMSKRGIMPRRLQQPRLSVGRR